MPIRQSSIPFVRKSLHLTLHGRPVWPIQVIYCVYVWRMCIHTCVYNNSEKQNLRPNIHSVYFEFSPISFSRCMLTVAYQLVFTISEGSDNHSVTTYAQYTSIQPWLIFSAIGRNTQIFSHLSALYQKSSIFWRYRTVPACLLQTGTIHGDILCIRAVVFVLF